LTGTGQDNQVRDLNELNHHRHPQEHLIAVNETVEEAAHGGAFLLPAIPPSKQRLKVVAANDAGWDHVSVSCPKRIPTWLEMEYVKRLFFNADETAMQLHLPPERHINIHDNVLHIWRPHDTEIPVPPAIFV
jgi:hypothetical protein